MEIIKVKRAGDSTQMAIHFGWGALRHWTNATGKSIADLEKGSEMTLEETMWLIWAGLKQGAYKAGESFDLTIEDVADLMDENPTFLPTALEQFSLSLATAGSPNPQAGAAPRKKKASR